ncbi:MAG: septal ring lytic transglycosylase RlpA family protein [Xanthobacteraceae bacterium]|jgi:rare lipoprotein A
MRRREDVWQRCRAARIGVLLAGGVALVGCSSSSERLAGMIDPKYGVSSSPRVVEPGQPVPKGGGTYRVGKPYIVGGRMYVPQENASYRNEGMASWYGEDFHGRLTANGEVYDMNSLSAAHPTLPMPCYVRVTNLANQRSLIVRVNDRGPYHGNREIDLSGKAAQLLGFADRGVARVRVEYVGAAPLQGSDDARLMATLRQGEPAPAPPGVMLASATPFVPDFAPRGAVLRGAIPVPEDRPFDLGERSTMRDAAIAADRRAAAGEPRTPWARPEAPPMTAYAPARVDAAAVTSGRGLY